MHERTRTALLACATAVTMGAAAPAEAAIGVHAHRGGSVIDGVAEFPENTLPAFQHAWDVEGAVLELDVKLSKDGVPIVIHDHTFERTTDCEGPVKERTAAEIRSSCRADVLGSPGSALDSLSKPAPNPVEVPTLAEVLAYAKGAGATLNMEIKNLPNDNDFDPTSGYANKVMDAVLASGFPKERLIVQSFWPPNIDAARVKMPGIQTSLLTLRQSNDGGPVFARSKGYDWISPGWPVDKTYVDEAHSLGLKVVPYTLDKAEEVKAAMAAGVDAVISDDPAMTRKTLGLPPRSQPAPGDTRAPSLTVQIATPSLRELRKRGSLPVRVTVDEGATVTLTAFARRRTSSGTFATTTVARREVTLSRAGTRRIRIGLTAVGRRLVKEKNRLRIRLSAQARDAAQNTRSRATARTLRR